jgi:hypothetical protein
LRKKGLIMNWNRRVLVSTFALAVACGGCKSNSNASAEPDTAGTAAATATATAAEAAAAPAPAAVTADAPTPEGVDTGNEDAEKAAEKEAANGDVPEPPADKDEPAGNPPQQGWVHYNGFWQWDIVGHRYLWVPGYWHDPNAMVTEAPPALRRETIGIAPGPGYIWAPGYWRWTGTNYGWVPGHYAWWYHVNYAYEHPRWEFVEGRWAYRDPFYARRVEYWGHYPEWRRTYAVEYGRARTTWHTSHAYVAARVEVRDREVVRVREHEAVRVKAGVHVEAPRAEVKVHVPEPKAEVKVKVPAPHVEAKAQVKASAKVEAKKK